MQFENMIGKSRGMQKVFERIRTVAPLNIPVLITGESGTGKELAALAIHNLSERKGKPFIPINTGAISQELISSEIFGHEKGAFTGAGKQHKGLFEIASEGTIFLDEISTMAEKAQVSLLRILETGKFKRVGGTSFLHTDARIIAATNENLRKKISVGSFRRDLYHRLRVFSINIPPLRKRREDIEVLAEEFLRHYSDEFGKDISTFKPEAMDLLRDYPWYGNVRELENTVSEAVIMCTAAEITPGCLPERFRKRKKKRVFSMAFGTSLEELENRYIRETMKMVKGNRKKAADILGVSRKTLYNKLKAMDPEPADPE